MNFDFEFGFTLFWKVVLATVIAYVAKLSENNGLNVVREIPAGWVATTPNKIVHKIYIVNIGVNDGKLHVV